MDLLDSNQKLNFTNGQKMHYTLRIASAMCFIGHGSFGIIKKPIWSNYFEVFGIGHNQAFKLMPVLGGLDILLGIIILLYPLRAIISWLVIWGIVTALLRPLSGEPFSEFIERAGNFGAPLALLLLSGGLSMNIRKLFTPVDPKSRLNEKTLSMLIMCLRLVVFLLLTGHGWLNILEKKSLLNEYAALGFVNPGITAQAVGIFEIVAAFVILVRPVRSLVLVLFIWKIASELFYPHYEIFEWIERGGSYGALLALWFALGEKPVFSTLNWFRRTRPGVASYNNSRLFFLLPVLTSVFLVSSCSNHKELDRPHIESLAKEFMKTDVIPKMKEPKPFEVTDAKVVTKTVADIIDDYRFTYEHLSLSHEDSVLNKRRLDSIIGVSKHPDSIVSITVNVGYKTKYKRGDIVTDSIKLGYNREKDKVTFWPF